MRLYKNSKNTVILSRIRGIRISADNFRWAVRSRNEFGMTKSLFSTVSNYNWIVKKWSAHTERSVHCSLILVIQWLPSLALRRRSRRGSNMKLSITAIPSPMIPKNRERHHAIPKPDERGWPIPLHNIISSIPTHRRGMDTKYNFSVNEWW